MTSSTQTMTLRHTEVKAGVFRLIDEQELEATYSPLWWHEQGLSYTASGYGKRIPTAWVVKYKGKTRRIYCRHYSNAGTLYLGKLGGDSNIILN